MNGNAPALCEHELASWLRLTQTEGVGARTLHKLLSHFGLPENIFDASSAALKRIVPERIAHALKTPPSIDTLDLIERTAQWLNEPCHHLLTLADARYPRALLETADPPALLYVKGRIELLEQPMLAIVGSRSPSQQGLENAQRFAQALAQSGLTIISGLALGIDTAAHAGALTEDASTVAVIGTGIDRIYPAQNRELARNIATTGCLISEYPLGTPAIPANFSRRNRIISGLSSGVLVVEAALKSGSLITARLAAEQSREVFAIPGSIHSPLAKGCHQLIKQGAKLVESAADILEELHLPQQRAVHIIPTESAEEPALLRTLGHDPIGLDTLSERTGFALPELLEQLLALELTGQIEVLADGRYRRLNA